MEDKTSREQVDRTWPEKAAALGDLATFGLFVNDKQLRDVHVEQQERASSQDRYTVTISALTA